MAWTPFIRQREDIYLELPITIDEAVLGGKLTLPAIDGNVSLTNSKNTSSGKRLRLKGRGVPCKGKRGDPHGTVKIVLPKERDDELETAIAE